MPDLNGGAEKSLLSCEIKEWERDSEKQQKSIIFTGDGMILIEKLEW